MKKRIRGANVSIYAAVNSFAARFSAVVLIVLSVGLVLYSTLYSVNVQHIRTRASDMFSPLIMAVGAPIQYVSDVLSSASGVANLKAENDRLMTENMKLREWYQTALQLQSENDRLQKLLNLVDDQQRSFITARVMADPGNQFVKSLLVSAGANDGVEKGQAVLSSDGMIGRIVEVGEKTARILLVTDLNSRIPVLIEGTGEKAILAGNNGAQVYLDHLADDVDVPVGARVVTSGHGGTFPPGLPLGQVDGKVDGTIWVNPFSRLSSVTHVKIIAYHNDPAQKTGKLE